MSSTGAQAMFCSQCGAGLKTIFDPGDNRQRRVCERCGFVAYENPKVLVACLATWEDKLLIIRRGTEPRKGYWAVPAGFMECGETPEEAAARELWEETRARVDPENLKLFLVGSLPDISEVYLVYRGELLSPEFEVTEEASEIALCTWADVPVEDIAYPDVAEFMENFFREHGQGSYRVYSARYAGGVHKIESAVD